MADLTSFPLTMAPVYPTSNGTEIIPYIADVALIAGQAVYITPIGTVGLCATAVAGHEQFRGLALQSCGAGQGVDVIRRGLVDGYDLSGLAYDALVYASDVAGNIGTAAGTKSVVVGRVQPSSNRDSSGNIKKLLWVNATDATNW